MELLHRINFQFQFISYSRNNDCFMFENCAACNIYRSIFLKVSFYSPLSIFSTHRLFHIQVWMILTACDQVMCLSNYFYQIVKGLKYYSKHSLLKLKMRRKTETANSRDSSLAGFFCLCLCLLPFARAIIEIHCKQEWIRFSSVYANCGIIAVLFFSFFSLFCLVKSLGSML